MNETIVKHLNFGKDAKDKIFQGIDKLTKAVSSTLGASGKCVILEDGSGNPQITKDGVTETVTQESSKFSYKPDSKTKFYAVQRLMYQHKHQFPPSFITVNGKKYLLPTWKEVHPDTTFDDVIHVKPELKKPVKETKTFASKSDPTITYKATRTTYPSGEVKHYCNCPGKWRAKDGMCKHLKAFA